jgi:hypothetical protein
LFQIDLISKGNTEKWDITLLSLMLKYSTSIKPFLPTNNDNNLDMLRNLRNSDYGHIPSTFLSEVDFNDMINNIKPVLLNVEPNKDEKLIIDAIINEPIDNNDERFNEFKYEFF